MTPAAVGKKLLWFCVVLVLMDSKLLPEGRTLMSVQG